MRLNGKIIRLEQSMTLSELLMIQTVDIRYVAVELNGVIVPKAEYDRIQLADEDTLEVVRFVGGG